MDQFVWSPQIDTDCLRNANTAAVLRLQAGFRFEYAPPLRKPDRYEDQDEEEHDATDSLADDIEHPLLEHDDGICHELDLEFHHVEDWLDAVVHEVFRSLKDVDDSPDYLPLTGHIDFADAIKALKKLKRQVVICG